MNLTTLLLLIGTAVALTALTWFGSTWWYGRKLADLQRRLEKTRLAANQHAGQARRQIMMLQKELAQRPPLNSVQRHTRDEAAERQAALEASLDETEPNRPSPTHGFADTQPM